MKRILSFFVTDLHWKLLSLALAFVLWVLAINMDNPMQNAPYNIMLQTMNMEILSNSGLVVVNPDVLDTEIQVRVRASRQDIEHLNSLNSAREQAQYITPSVDFRVVNVDEVLNSDGPVTVQLDVSVDLHEYYEHFSIRPSHIEVEIDVLTHASFPVDVYIAGEVDSGLELQPIRLANNRVTITGTRTRLARIEHVQVEVDVWGIHEDEEQANLPLRVFDFEGNDMTDLVQLSVNETTATVSVWPVETIDVQVVPIGSLALGFAVEDIDHDPKTVEVVGAIERLRELEYILIEVDLADRNASFIESIDIREWLQGVALRSEENPMIDVAVIVEPVERRIFNVPMDNVLTRGASVDYDLLSEMTFIRIDVYGPRTLLEDLSGADIGLELDLRRLPIGTHNVTLSVDLPEGVYLAQQAPSLRIQIREPAAADEDDDPTEVIELPSEPVPSDTENDDPSETDTMPDDTTEYPYESATYTEVSDPDYDPSDEETDD